MPEEQNDKDFWAEAYNETCANIGRPKNWEHRSYTVGILVGAFLSMLMGFGYNDGREPQLWDIWVLIVAFLAGLITKVIGKSACLEWVIALRVCLSSKGDRPENHEYRIRNLVSDMGYHDESLISRVSGQPRNGAK